MQCRLLLIMSRRKTLYTLCNFGTSPLFPQSFLTSQPSTVIPHFSTTASVSVTASLAGLTTSETGTLPVSLTSASLPAFSSEILTQPVSVTTPSFGTETSTLLFSPPSLQPVSPTASLPVTRPVSGIPSTIPVTNSTVASNCLSSCELQSNSSDSESPLSYLLAL